MSKRESVDDLEKGFFGQSDTKAKIRHADPDKALGKEKFRRYIARLWSYLLAGIVVLAFIFRYCKS